MRVLPQSSPLQLLTELCGACGDYDYNHRYEPKRQQEYLDPSKRVVACLRVSCPNIGEAYLKQMRDTNVRVVAYHDHNS